MSRPAVGGDPGAIASSDIGGTFTDVTVLDGERITVRKVPSTPPTFDVGATEGMTRAIAEAGIGAGTLTAIRHATTVATNAILEGRGSRTGLLTTEGFRDVLELRRARSPELYNLFYRPPDPLVPRRLRIGVRERLGPDGTVLQPLDVKSATSAIEILAGVGVESIAICLLHAYRNPVHERALAGLARATLPGAFLSTSADVLPEMGEYERTSTTVINAYLGPIVAAYLSRMKSRLDDLGHTAPIFVMQSSGALMDLAIASREPARMVESGPAAGVIGALSIVAEQGLGDAVTLDMGGTTTKAGLIEGGRPLLTSEYEVGPGISSTTGHGSGRGYALRLPVLDIAEVGAGGGSIIRVDAVGRLTVGPQSAGADPGPACYGRGGEEPTLTDALVALGWINPESLAGGVVRLAPARARRAIADRVAAPLGLSLEEAAQGAFRVALAETARAVKHVTTFRGRRPADYVLIAYGGNGPVVGAALAKELGITRVIVPPAAGVFSSYGLLEAEEAHHFVRPVIGALMTAGQRVAEGFAELSAQASGFKEVRQSEAEWGTARIAELRYRDQRAALRVPADEGEPDRRWLDTLAERFATEHERTYGHRAAVEDVELVNLRLVVSRPPRQRSRARIADDAARGRAARGDRRLRFGSGRGWLATPSVDRAAIGTGAIGPLVVDEYDATIVIPPGWGARVDDHGNVALQALDG